MILNLLFSFAVMAATTPRTVELNNKAAQDIVGQNYQEAQEKLIKALGKDPLSPELQFNLGLTFLGLHQPDKAKSSFEFAAQMAKNPQTRFMAYFNLGFMAGKEQKIDEALADYQKALDINPDSVETKTNIELLTQQQSKNQQGGQSQEQNKNGKGDDKKDQNGQDKDKKPDQSQNENKKYQQPKPQPKPFKSQELTQGDVNKILGEIKQQEQKIRAEYNKQDAKEKARGKDW